MLPELSRISDAKLRRKVNKPLVEKKRRERINKYLYELHELLTESGQASASSKLEKADILEMAVSHIRRLKKQLDRTSSLSDSDERPSSQPQLPAHAAQSYLHVSIPNRSYSPASSISSISSDYPSPPANKQMPYYFDCNSSAARLPLNPLQPNPASYQGTIVPVQGGGYAVLFNQRLLQQQQQQLPQKAASKSSTAMWRPW